MAFPITIKHRDTKARIYGKSEKYPYYRISYRSGGKRHLKHFSTFAEAKAEAERVVRDVSKGAQSLALSNREATEALAIREKLQSFRRETGRSITALEAVSGYLSSLSVLPASVTPEQASRDFAENVGVVQTKGLKDATEEFIAGRVAKTFSKDGRRPELSPLYVANTSAWLRDFAKSLSGHMVTDISKAHFEIYLSGLKNHSPKARNDRRAILRAFLGWCARKDYLPANHRLLESVGLEREKLQESTAGIYTFEEFQRLLTNCSGELKAMLAIQGLAGLRRDEALRLTWEDAFRREGYIEITSSKAKTGSRRLVAVCPMLSGLLEPFKGATGPIWTKSRGQYVYSMNRLFQKTGVEARDNGLRHSFCSYHLALHENENVTAAQAGNSAVMVHRHYKSLTTRAQAEKWFSVKPSKS